jgi:hypothetical protein
MDKKDQDYIDYGKLIDESMHIIVKKALQSVEQNGLLGNHHFFISFLTTYPGAKISEHLLNKYPEEMTIVLQYQYSNLVINEDDFTITLSFDNVKEDLVIPFSALTAFADPSVKFGLQFRHVLDEDGYEEEEGEGAEITDFIMDNKTGGKDAKNGSKVISKKNSDNVITLDSFRKK